MTVELSDLQLLALLLLLQDEFTFFTDGFVDKDYNVVGYDGSLKDEDFEIGDHFTKTAHGTQKRIVSLAVYIA